MELLDISNEFQDCKEHNDYVIRYHRIKKRLNISDTKDILSVISLVEEKDKLGALLIVEKKEKALSEYYVDDFLKRRKKQVIDDLREDYRSFINGRDNKVPINSDSFEILFIIMMHIDDSDCRALCDEITGVFENDVSSCAQFFCKALEDFPDTFPWMRHYTRISKMIYESLGECDFFIRAVESGLRNKQFILRPIDVEGANNAYEYYCFLCQKGLYDTAVFFLNHYDISENFFGRDMGDEINKMFAYPSPKILSYARWKKRTQLDESYYYEEWDRDIREYNHDPEILRWLDVTMFFYKLANFQEQEQKENFDKLLDSASQIEMFDVQKNRYLTRISWDSMRIVNTMLLSEPDRVLDFLDKIKHININDFNLSAYSFNSNVANCNESGFDFRHIKDILFDRFAIDDALFIYMNTHLKHAIRLDDVIERLSSLGVDIKAAFSKYPLDGIISDVDVKASVRNKIFITPRNIVHDLDYHKVISATQAYGNRNHPDVKKIRATLIRTSENWYARNKEYAELARIKDECTFYIGGYERGSGIFAIDVTLREDVVEKRNDERNNVFPEHLLAWLGEIRKEKKHIIWDSRIKVYSTACLDNNKRDQIAIEILKAAEALMDHPYDLRLFINALCSLPLEDANECRYIHSQKGLNFSFSGSEYRNYIRMTKTISERIMSSDKLSDNLKYMVFINTCMKKYYDFDKAYKHIGKELLFDAQKASEDPFYEPFYLWLSYEGETDQYLRFSTRIVLKRQLCNIFFTHCEFRYKGKYAPIEKRRGYVYKTIIESYDETEHCFWLKEIGVQTSWGASWNKYMRLVNDLKNAAIDEAFEKARRELAFFQHYTRSEEKLYTLSRELVKIFKSQQYEMTKAFRTLNALGKSNPFADMSNTLENSEQGFSIEFAETYKKFLNSYREKKGSSDLFCDVYFNSFLRVSVPKEQFFMDITDSEEEKEKLIEHCRLKGYIK